MTKQDLLQRNEYVELLESLIDNKIQNNKGFSFAIDGPWGCGKSFILKLLKENLESKGYLVIHYNCWDNDFYREPLIAILSTIVDKLNNITLPETAENKQKKNKINIALKFLKSILFMIAKNKFKVDLEEIGIELDELKGNVSETLEADQKPYLSNDFDSNLSIKQVIKELREHLLDLQSEWSGIVFFIDELDRCLPNYAINVLERLHHICFDSENDDFKFIQLLAINKKELSNSIYKAFGKVITAGNDKPFHDEPQIFADYYLQKFIQLIIPVPPGAILNDSSVILDGFENDFYGFDGVYKNLIDDFFSSVMSDFSMRSKMELVSHTKMAHQLTLAKYPELHDLFCGVLIVELVDCLYRFLLKRMPPELEYGNVEHVGKLFWLDGSNGKIYAPNKIDFLDLAKLKEWSQTPVDHINTEYEGGGIRFDASKYPENYMKYFYISDKSRITSFNTGLQKDYIPFVKAYRKTLDIIAPIK